MPYSRTLWQNIRTRWKQSHIPGDPVEASAEWFYLNRATFSGDQKRGGFASPSTTGRNPAQSYFNAIDGLEGIARRLRGVTIECRDYADCIRRYDSPETCFYVDCPYYGSEHYYEQGNFNHEDHHALAKLLHEVRGVVMLSRYQCDLYDRFYSGWNKYMFQSFKGSSKASSGESKPKTVECLYTNFEPPLRNKMLPGF